MAYQQRAAGNGVRADDPGEATRATRQEPPADAEQVTAAAAATDDRDAAVWLAANVQFLRTRPGAAAREAAGARLAGGRQVRP
jgi:hypothetical protein